MSTYLTADQLADCMQVEPSTIRRWARERRIPSMRPSHKVLRFDLDSVLRALRSEERVAAAFALADELRRELDDEQTRLEFDDRWREEFLERQGLRVIKDDDIRARLIEIREGVVSGGNQ